MSSNVIEAINPIGQKSSLTCDNSGHLIISGTTGGGGTDPVPDLAPTGTHTSISSVGLFGQNDSPTADNWRALQVNGDGELKVQTSNAGSGDNIQIKAVDKTGNVEPIKMENNGALFSSNFGTSNTTPPVITPVEVNADGKLQVQIVGSVDINGSAPHRHLTIDTNGRTLTAPIMTATNNAIASTTASVNSTNTSVQATTASVNQVLTSCGTIGTSITAQTQNDISGLCKTQIMGTKPDTTQAQVNLDTTGNIQNTLKLIDSGLVNNGGLKVSIVDSTHSDTNDINVKSYDTSLVDGANGLKVSVQNNPQIVIDPALITSGHLKTHLGEIATDLIGTSGTAYTTGLNVNVINSSGETPDGSGSHRDFYSDTANFSVLNTQSSGTKRTLNTNAIYGPNKRSGGTGDLPSAMNPVCVNANGNMLTEIHGTYYDEGQVPSLTSGTTGEILVGRTGSLRVNKNYLKLVIGNPNGGVFTQPHLFSTPPLQFMPLFDNVNTATGMLNAMIDMSAANNNNRDYEVQHIHINISMDTTDTSSFLDKTAIPLDNWNIALFGSNTIDNYNPSVIANDLGAFDLFYSTDSDLQSGSQGYKGSICTSNLSDAHWQFYFKYNGIIPYRYVLPMFFVNTQINSPLDNPNMTAKFYAG